MGPIILMGCLVDSKGKRLICSISNAVTHETCKTKLTLDASATDTGAEHLLDCCRR